MGWGTTEPGTGRTRLTWPNDEWNRAAALCAGQLPVAWLVWWFAEVAGSDDYGRGHSGSFGMAVALLAAPLVLPFLGVLHATAQIMPAATLARLRLRPSGGPEWVRHLVMSVLAGTAWSAAGAVLWEWPFTATLLWFAGLGVLPVLGLARLRGRGAGPWGVWLRSAGASVALLAVVGVSGSVLVGDYEPPALSAGQLAGEWRGRDGAVLVLRAGGRAESAGLPATRADGGAGDFTVCDGTGTWSVGRDGLAYAPERDGVLVRLDGGCGQETYWTIGGSERDPELFVLFGDPDSGDLRILTRT
ncbi:hypothetical protein [Streptomyces pactum]|uniref:Uncharacterized protein n=1 Tax=Streptomyces pactum TaxID=68249 RepID=A0A1S6JBD7_9ACTN|nr:hypothetical protein [Streptomyces pactum]AQS69080.1 hypothetical protein B1H29_21140 [Streptomyces pactum]